MKLLEVRLCQWPRTTSAWTPAKLVVSEVFATPPGPILKRMMPRAQGRAYRINKKTSHVTLGRDGKGIRGRRTVLWDRK